MSFPIPVLSSLISKGIDGIIKWKSSSDKREITRMEFDAMKEQWKLEMNKYLLDQVGRPDREFRQFVLSYEGSGDNVHPVVQFMRGAIRPFITVWVIVIITLFMFNGEMAAAVGENMKSIPPDLWTIFQYVIGFWFGGRAVQHAIGQYSNGKVEESKKQAHADMEVERERTRQMKIEAGMTTDDEDEESDSDFTEKEKRRAFRHRKGAFRRR
ncbi:MAG: holin family protein [Agarilytica sp.]